MVKLIKHNILLLFMGGNKNPEKIVIFVTLFIIFTIFFSAFVSSVNSIDSGLVECFEIGVGEVSLSECPKELCYSEFLIHCMKINEGLDNLFGTTEECISFEM